MNSGRLIAHRFELDREMGSGGMGTVWRARDVTTGACVALKLIHPGAPRDRFAQEATLLAAIDHPGVVRYVAHGEANGAPYLAMEWLEGESLDVRLARGPLGVDEALVLGARVAEALAAAHACGVVHRDLKPANILLAGSDAARPKLIDFGIAHAERATALKTKTGITMGTPGYMAPEQARGEQGLDGRADAFSLGCVLFECMTGRAAFSGEHVMAILSKILLEEPPRLGEFLPASPPALDELIARMLSKDKQSRPADAMEIARRLEALVGAPPRPKPSSSLVPPGSLTGREQRFAAIILRADLLDADTPTLNDEETAEVATLQFEEIVLETLREHGGKLEMIAGVGMVLLLPGEGSATDLAARAVACALALRDGSPIALATGRAEMGQKVPVGEAIDRAARLLKGRKKGPLWIDETTASLLGDGFEGEVHDGATMVLERREADAVRTLLGKPTACVGREPWLAALEAVFTEAMEQPEARAAVVTAPAGVGKSRLRHELLRRLRARDLEVWTAGGDVIGAGSAFGLAGQMVRHAAGVFDADPLALRQEKLRQRVALHVPAADQRRVTIFLGEMTRARFGSDGEVQLQAARRDPIVMGDQIRRAWEDFVDAETREHPLALVLENLHWGDKPTVDLVDSVMRLFPKRPLFVLAFGRPEVDALFPDLWAQRPVERIALPPLPRSAAERLARSVLGAQSVDVARVVEQAQGNAFYLEELIRAVAEGRGERLPDTVLASVEARVAELDADARKALRAASVFGEVFWAGGVRELAGDAAAAKLGVLEAKEMIGRRSASTLFGESEIVFRHAMVREAAYAMLIEADRVLGHRLAADWLEQRGDADAFTIAEHLERGGERARAATAFLRAAEQALEAGDLAQALTRAERGVASGAEGELLGRLRLVQADAHRWRGEPAAALLRAEEAKALVEPFSDAWGDAAGEIAVSAIRVGDVDRLVAAGEGLLAAVEGSRPSAGVLRGAARASSCMSPAGRGELASALLASIDAHGDRAPASVQALSAQARAQQALYAGDLAAYLEHQSAAVAVYDALGAARMACVARSYIGYAHLELGAFAQAEVIERSVLSEAARMQLAGVLPGAHSSMGEILGRLGRFEEAVQFEREAVGAFRARGDARLEGGSRVYLAEILLGSGELARAEDEARTAAELLHATPECLPYAQATTARALLARGRHAEALAAARDAMSGLEALGGTMEEGEAEVRLAHAEALEAAGDRVGAHAAIAKARTRVLERAGKITDVRWKKSFVENVPEHARTMRLAEAWLEGE